MKSIIDSLHTEVERLTQRCNALQAFLSATGNAADWDRRIEPLSLYETRVMRLVCKRRLTGNEAVRILSAWYPETNSSSLDVMLNRLRKRLPTEIAPSARLNGSRYAAIDVPDRPALAAFLESGVLPDVRRVA